MMMNPLITTDGSHSHARTLHHVLAAGSNCKDGVKLIDEQ